MGGERALLAQGATFRGAKSVPGGEMAIILLDDIFSSRQSLSQENLHLNSLMRVLDWSKGQESDPLTLCISGR